MSHHGYFIASSLDRKAAMLIENFDSSQPDLSKEALRAYLAQKKAKKARNEKKPHSHGPHKHKHSHSHHKSHTQAPPETPVATPQQGFGAFLVGLFSFLHSTPVSSVHHDIPHTEAVLSHYMPEAEEFSSSVPASGDCLTHAVILTALAGAETDSPTQPETTPSLIPPQSGIIVQVI